MRFGLAMVFCLAGLVLAAPAWAAPGLVAAYSFDEGSGPVAVDASGNGQAGAIVGASWTMSGRYDGALSFDGTNDYVGLPGLGTFYNGGFTLEAWVQKATTKNDVGIVGTWTGNGPMLWVDHLATRHHLTLGGTCPVPRLRREPSSASGSTSPPPSTAPPPASTSTAPRLPHGLSPAASARRIHGGSAPRQAPAGFFDGLIDKVRIYDRALRRPRSRPT